MGSAYSVSQVNHYLSELFRQDFLLRRLTVKGEVSNCKYHSSGHIYFTLKDEGGTLAAVMFAGKRLGLKFRLEDGQKVCVTGSIQIYEAAGRVQMYADRIEMDGLGDLYVRFEALKQELQEMGMFSSEYKKPIPPYVRTLGVVTAPTGAAIRDIINVSSRRNPYVQLILCPAQVQGEGAAESIASAVERLDELGTDCMIVGRGGGSMEDLWAFNERIVAEAIFNCQTPVISAVGHEVDYTIADFVADLRAPTPSAAAELAVFEIHEFERNLSDYQERLNGEMEGRILDERRNLQELRLKLLRFSPESRLNTLRMQLSEEENRLTNRMERLLTERKHELALLAQRLDQNSPLAHFRGGYAYTSHENRKAVRSVKELKAGEMIQIYYQDGNAQAEILSVNPNSTESRT